MHTFEIINYVLLDTLERIRKKQHILFSMEAYGSASNLLPEHIGLPAKIINLH